ncbi:hypothetical protein Nepgr_023193 [Nepenthes gracilis]|uniref:Reverse transcriptase domain-containing protein n=1 Tax=Nepenthes gracilis TaxID=150966 RepID=A0AAD3T3V4_NEPGR|nr:hypothetical protein Nepgr_023193 [Nepenthes gracilis]
MTLPYLVDKCQTAFVAGRQISNNILLTQEFLHKYHLGHHPPRCTMKVDLKKAYDSVHWDFIINVLTIMKFPPKMINWIKECITTPSYSVNINGEAVGFFKGGKGLRQGDPISPYLFVLAMEVLNGIIESKARNNKNFTFHWNCGQTHTVMLAFADDLLLFSHADVCSIRILKDCLEEFYWLSGLSANTNKSEVFLCSNDPSLTQNIADVLGFKVGSLPIRYPGVPLISTRLSIRDFGGLDPLFYPYLLGFNLYSSQIYY